jgi:hypothetical protein
LKSWEVLRDAADRIGVKALAARLNLSTALVYKWCQESPQEDPSGSGARNPLDRLREIYDATGDEAVVNWLCHAAGGFFCRNPEVPPHEHEEHLLGATQRFVSEFGDMLSQVSRSVKNDGQITPDEAKAIRGSWEKLKGTAERFTHACEQGLYRHGRRK